MSGVAGPPVRPTVLKRRGAGRHAPAVIGRHGRLPSLPAHVLSLNPFGVSVGRLLVSLLSLCSLPCCSSLAAYLRGGTLFPLIREREHSHAIGPARRSLVTLTGPSSSQDLALLNCTN